jgi:hypothetical protein
MVIVLLFLAGSLSAQDAGEMDRLLETGVVSGPQAARFVLASAGLLDSGLSGRQAEDAAWQAALEQGWVSSKSGQLFRLKDAAWLVAAAFGIKGGAMYSLFPGPRYAYRELLHLKIIQGRADGNFAVSGERLLQIIGRALQHTGEDGRLEAELLTTAGEQDAPPAGQGLSSGPEGLMPYEEEFTLE